MEIPAWAPTLTDGVVTLRAHRAEDVPDVVAACRDPQFQRWTTVPSPYEYRHGEQFVATRREEWEARRTLAFAVEDATGCYAGTVDLRPDGTAADVGYGLGPWARGRGVAGRALRLLLGWGFGEVGFEVVHWKAEVGNWPSRRVAWSAGFRVHGVVAGLLPDRPGPDGGPPRRLDGWLGSLRRGESLEPVHPWLAPPVLSDGRVRLRAHREDDLPRMVEACADPVTQAWLPDLPPKYTEANARAHLEEIRAHHADAVALYWAFTPPDEDVIAGEVGVFGLTPSTPPHSVEVGYWTHPGRRGRGLTTAALRLVVRHALLPVDVGGLGARRVLVRAAEGNVASRHVAEMAGLRPCGLDRDVEVLRDGTVTDLVRYDAIARELAVDEPDVVRDLLGETAALEVGRRRMDRADDADAHDDANDANGANGANAEGLADGLDDGLDDTDGPDGPDGHDGFWPAAGPQEATG